MRSVICAVMAVMMVMFGAQGFIEAAPLVTELNDSRFVILNAVSDELEDIIDEDAYNEDKAMDNEAVDDEDVADGEAMDAEDTDNRDADDEAMDEENEHGDDKV